MMGLAGRELLEGFKLDLHRIFPFNSDLEPAFYLCDGCCGTVVL